MKKFALAIVLASLAVACGGEPSKSEVCDSCGDTEEPICEMAYETCADTQSCDLNELAEHMKSFCN